MDNNTLNGILNNPVWGFRIDEKIAALKRRIKDEEEYRLSCKLQDDEITRLIETQSKNVKFIMEATK